MKPVCNKCTLLKKVIENIPSNVGSKLSREMFKQGRISEYYNATKK
jgi:hypothetical protein